MAINWNIVPAFYNDSYTYMEWLGKVTAKVEDHETRLTQAEADIDQLQEDFATIQNTLEDHEERIKKNTDDIADLTNTVDDISGRVETLETWYTEYASEAVSYVWNNMAKISTVINTTVPTLQEQTAENTAAIISLQREGTTLYIDVMDDTDVSSIINITTTYTPLIPTEKAVDMIYKVSCTIDGNTEIFVLRDFVHVGDTTTGIAFNADGYITYSIDITTAGTIAITLGDSSISGTAYTDTDISASTVLQADIVLHADKTVTPTSEKEAYQASVKIFSDKTIPIDSRTTSFILQYYSAASTDPTLTWADWANAYNAEHQGGLQIDPNAYPDTNRDGKINAIDATNISTYYSNASTGKTQYLNNDADKFWNWYLAGNPPVWDY